MTREDMEEVQKAVANALTLHVGLLSSFTDIEAIDFEDGELPEVGFTFKGNYFGVVIHPL